MFSTQSSDGFRRPLLPPRLETANRRPQFKGISKSSEKATDFPDGGLGGPVPHPRACPSDSLDLGKQPAQGAARLTCLRLAPQSWDPQPQACGVPHRQHQGVTPCHHRDPRDVARTRASPRPLHPRAGLFLSSRPCWSMCPGDIEEGQVLRCAHPIWNVVPI